MRALSALVLALLVSVPLSGCIDGLFVGPAQRAPTPSPEPGWVQLPMPTVRPASGILGVWVPDHATGLRVQWAMDTAANWSEPYDSFPDRPDLITIHGPGGDRLFMGGPDNARSRVPGMPPRALDLLDPASGLYVIAFHGDIAPPQIHIRAHDDIALAPALALPNHFERHLLVESFTATNGVLNAQGTLTSPARPTTVHPDILGVGAGGYVRITNTTGGDIATVDIPITSAPGTRDFSFGLDPGSVLRFDRFDLDALDTTMWHYDARLLGSGVAFAWIGVTADLAPPHAAIPTRFTAADDHAQGRGAHEQYPLAGALGRWEAAWFDMPQDALFVPRYDGEGDNRFRVYDDTGTRLLWDTIEGTGGPYVLPAGRLLVINDGDDILAVDLVGRPGPDSALHVVDYEILSATIAHDAAPGWFDESISVHVPGPVLSWDAGRSVGYASDLHVTVSADNVTLATAPTRAGVPYGAYPCCPAPLVTTHPGDPHWLDGGRYRVAGSGSEGQGSLVILFTYIDLESAHQSDAPVPNPDLALRRG